MKRPAEKVLKSRRQVLGGTLRYATLGVLGAGVGAVVMKRRRLLREGVCVSRGICTRCGEFAECGLPRARSVRRALEERADG